MNPARFSYAAEGEPVEIVTLRATAIGRLPKPEEEAPTPPDAAVTPGARRVWPGGAATDWPVYRREHLRLSDGITGPAIIEEAFATRAIAAGWQAGLDPEGAIIARGVRNDGVWAMIHQNIRKPDLLLGDLSSQLASLEVGAAALLLHRQHGPLRPRALRPG